MVVEWKLEDPSEAELFLVCLTVFSVSKLQNLEFNTESPQSEMGQPNFDSTKTTDGFFSEDLDA